MYILRRKINIPQCNEFCRIKMLAETKSISYCSMVSGFKDVTVKGVVTVFVGQAGWAVTVPSARLA